MKYLLLPLLLSLAIVTGAQEPPAPGYSPSQLGAYGPIKTPAETEATFAKALAELTAANGGILIVPPEAPPAARLENTARWSHSVNPASCDLRDWKIGPGVLVMDLRGGTTRVMVPQVTDTRSRGGMVINRTMRLPAGDSLQHWTEESALSIENDIIHGPCNYLDWIVEPVKAGADARFYVPQVRNLFKGMYLNAHHGPGYQAPVARITVKDLGYDPEKRLYYFTADTTTDLVAGAIVQNKSHTPAMRIQNNFHASNQTFDFYLERNQYGNGDSYLVNATFGYMGNVHSMAGDENGSCYVAYIRSLTDVFRAKAKSWDAATGKLVFQGAANAHTLGNSRPLINLNPARWITAGSVLIVPAESYWDTVDTGKYPFGGKTYPTSLAPTRGSNINGLRMGGLIRLSAEAPVDASAIGRFFAVDEPTEYVPGQSANLRRWYEITGVTVNADGTRDLLIQRHWWGAKDAGSPTLYSPDNYTFDGHLRPLKYIIAPGAYVNDLREAVGNESQRQGIPPYTLGLTPSPVTGTPLDFAAGDDLEQAIGPDPFKPQGFRAWSFDAVPGAWPSAMVDLANHGATARDTGVAVQGGPARLEDCEKRLEKKPAWGSALRINSATGTGIEFNADVAHAALLFKQPYRDQPIKWQYGSREPGRPIAEATLAVSNQTGDLRFDGGAVNVPGGIVTRGLSADAAPARNLRGKNLPVAAGATELAVTFPQAETDADYALFLEQTWLTNRAVAVKTPTGFTVRFAEPAPAGATIDWMIIR